MAPTYFHGSRKYFEKQQCLSPQPDGYVHQEDVLPFELLMEERRPYDKLSRFDSVYLTDDPQRIDAAGGFDDAVYLVEPHSEPQASDLAWYSEAWCEHQSDPVNQERLNFLIDQYWSGEPFPTSAGNMEYRVTGCTVLEIVELNAEISDLEVVGVFESGPCF